MKKIFLTGLIISTMFLNSGCDSSDVAAGAIGVAIGIGIGSGGHDHHHDHGRRPPRYRQCGRHRCYSAQREVGVAENTKLVEFAQRHQISLEAAEQIQVAFDAVPTEGLSAFARIGLSTSDIRVISLRSMPKAESVASMAAHLNIEEAKAKSLLQGIVADFDAQASDIESPYWQACLAKGQWKTPENAKCSVTSWSGCSPETGATLCY